MHNYKIEKDYVLKVPMKEEDQLLFSKAFRKSKFRSKAEFVRFLVRQYITAMGK